MLYDLHGLGDNEQSLMNTGAWSLIQDLREQGKIGEFLIVTPDGGSSFYINSRDGRVRYNDFFLREFMPAIERRYRVRAGRTSRGITGMSMGGYGALRLGFRPSPTLLLGQRAQRRTGCPAAGQFTRGPRRTFSPRGNDRRIVRKSHRSARSGMPTARLHWQEKTPLNSPASGSISIAAARTVTASTRAQGTCTKNSTSCM